MGLSWSDPRLRFFITPLLLRCARLGQRAVPGAGHGGRSSGWAGPLQALGSVRVSFLFAGILVSWPGMKPASPALEGGVLTPGPPGKSRFQIF